MRVFLRPAAGLLLFEALLALWVLSGVAIGLLTLQGRALAQAHAAQVRALILVEAGALLAGMRVNPQWMGTVPHWRHYQAPQGCGSGAVTWVDARGLAQRQLCRLEQGLLQVLPRSDFAYATCAQTTGANPLVEAEPGALRLVCPVGAVVDGWALHVAWRLEAEVYTMVFRASHA